MQQQLIADVNQAATPAGRLCCAGIDPSLSGTAVAFALPNAEPYEQRITSKPAETVQARVLRYRSIVEPIVELAIAHQPELVLIEGYSFASAGGQVRGRAHDRAEYGGVLRDRLLDHVGLILEVPPSTLKKWATGRGNAQKPEVVSALSKRYDRTFRTDDAADAWALMTLAEALLGQRAAETKAQAEVLKTMMPKLRGVL